MADLSRNSVSRVSLAMPAPSYQSSTKGTPADPRASFRMISYATIAAVLGILTSISSNIGSSIGLIVVIEDLF